MHSGLIIVNAYSELKTGQNQADRLREEFSKRGHSVEIRRNDCFFAEIKKGEVVRGEALKDKNYDFIVYLDKDKYVSEMLETLGYRLFNRHAAVRVCDDKFATFLALAGNGIPMPDTLPGLLCYSPEAAVKEETLLAVEKRLGYPVIVKESYGSLGKGVYMANDGKELHAVCEKVKCTAHLFQRCVTTSLGKDVRVIVIGGKVVAAMKRTSAGDFRSNIELGGKGEKFGLSEKDEALCVKCADILGLDFCGIDLLFDKDGLTVCEVNSNAFFGGTEQATGINVAGLYAEHIIKTIERQGR